MPSNWAACPLSCGEMVVFARGRFVHLRVSVRMGLSSPNITFIWTSVGTVRELSCAGLCSLIEICIVTLWRNGILAPICEHVPIAFLKRFLFRSLWRSRFRTVSDCWWIRCSRELFHDGKLVKAVGAQLGATVYENYAEFISVLIERFLIHFKICPLQ